VSLTQTIQVDVDSEPFVRLRFVEEALKQKSIGTHYHMPLARNCLGD